METNEIKLKECYELVKKINETFGVIIDSEKKDASTIWFRFYLVDKFKDEATRVCYAPLKKHHSTILYIRKELPKLKQKQEYKDILEVIKSNNPDYFKLFIKKHTKKRYDKSKTNPENEPTIKRLQMPKSEAMVLLRKNPKSNLWNKNISNWNYKDWQELLTY